MTEAHRELSARWRHARRAALRAVLSDSTSETGDEELLRAALLAAPAAAQRAVFDNSLRLGRGYAAVQASHATFSELVGALPELGVACAERRPRAPDDDSAAVYLEREACPVAALGPAGCDFYREAMAGLVLGMTGGAMHARHDSAGHGGARCVDAVYLDPEWSGRHGPVPDELRPHLEAAARTLSMFDSRARVEFLGVSEGVLHYAVKGAGGTGGLRLGATLERLLARRAPGLSLREVSPRAVFVDES
ncbi:MAG: hypothetical protein IT374_03745 [Polyangiaceae bacterium]|nr:hypothetical protein [Polyangiaceae bacterium]